MTTLASEIVAAHRPQRAYNGRLACSCGHIIATAGQSPDESGYAAGLHVAEAAIAAADQPTEQPALTAIADRIGELVDLGTRLLTQPPKPTNSTGYQPLQEIGQRVTQQLPPGSVVRADATGDIWTVKADGLWWTIDNREAYAILDRGDYTILWVPGFVAERNGLPR